MEAKKRTRRVPKRLNTPFLKHGIEEINNEIEKAYSKVTGKDKLWQTYDKIKVSDAETCFRQYRGKCVFCDTRLSYLGRATLNAARLMFYVPLKVGGEARPDNLIVVCAPCKQEYRDTRKLRQDITGLDSFADCCEQLFEAVIENADSDRIKRIKARLNNRLSDIATCMRYVTTEDWEPQWHDKIIEGKNTIGDRLKLLAEGEDMKATITNDVKQIVTTKKYRIMREPTDE